MGIFHSIDELEIDVRILSHNTQNMWNEREKGRKRTSEAVLLALPGELMNQILMTLLNNTSSIKRKIEINRIRLQWKEEAEEEKRLQTIWHTFLCFDCSLQPLTWLSILFEIKGQHRKLFKFAPQNNANNNKNLKFVLTQDIEWDMSFVRN